MAKIGEQHFFALERLKGDLERAGKKRIKVEKLKWVDRAAHCLQIAMGEREDPDES